MHNRIIVKAIRGDNLRIDHDFIACRYRLMNSRRYIERFSNLSMTFVRVVSDDDRLHLLRLRQCRYKFTDVLVEIVWIFAA
jgi:hypothetical protein